MDFSELTELSSLEEIRGVLEKGALYGGDILQPSDTEPSGNHTSRISEIIPDLTGHTVAIKLSSVVTLDLKKPIYVQLNYRRTIFKIEPDAFLVNTDSVICHLPLKIHALSQRSGGERYLLEPSAGLSISLKRAERNMRELTHEMEVRIVDVSKQGFGIIISSYNRAYFKENDYFWLRAVHHKELRAPILGTVCYVSSKTTKNGNVRVGLSLSLALEDEILEELKRESLLILVA